MKAINIRNYSGKASRRKKMGLFKALAYAKDITQEDMLNIVVSEYYQNNKEEVKTILKDKRIKAKDFE